MTNYVFVDFDGPMLPGKLTGLKANKHLFTAFYNKEDIKNYIPVFDQFAIYALNYWAEHANIEVVFSTNWATVISGSLDERKHYLKTVLISNGYFGNFAKEVLTPKKLSSSRHTEIYLWLEDNFVIGQDQYITLDDIDVTVIKSYHPEFTGHITTVNYNNGLSWQQFKDLNTFLNIKESIIL